jgi:chemotaxis protein CheD
MKQKISIHIGEYHASRDPAVISTVLGSSVAVCLFDPKRRIGGMNHILLPGKADMEHFDAAARYGINAMELLINRIMNLGGHRGRFVAKVFGGAHVLPAISKENGVVEKNTAFVLAFLKNEGIRILCKDVRGTHSRKIRFHTDTNEVFLRRIPCMTFKNAAIEEKRRFLQVKKDAEKEGDVLLFQENRQHF